MTWLVPVLTLAMVAGACGRKPEPQAPQPQPETPPARNPVDEEAERARREAEEARLRAEAAERMRATLAEMVFFDYDRSELSTAARSILDAKVVVLRENPGVRLRIEGHADERGSVEYNLALGMRRAASVRDYLTGFGLDAARFSIETFGEDRPLAQGSNETAWARNRRAEFIVTAGVAANR